MTASLREGRLLLVPLLVLLAAPGCSCERRGSSSARMMPGPRPAAPVASPAVPAPAGLPPPAAQPGSAAAPAPLTACRSDDDCVSVAGDCCGCNAGGRQAVVARAKLDEFEAARAKRCAEAVCVALMSSHASCSQQPRCVGGSCRLVAAGAGGVRPAAPR